MFEKRKDTDALSAAVMYSIEREALDDYSTNISYMDNDEENELLRHQKYMCQ